MKEFFLTTERLGFSLWDENDIGNALELWGNPQVTKFITVHGEMLEEEIYKRLNLEMESYEKYKVQYWPIYYKENNESLGCCGLRQYDEEKKIFEMGIHLKDKYWGSGIATEACLAVMNYGFNVIKARGLFAGHNPKNIGSAKLLRKLGFIYTHDEFYPPTGVNHPSYLIMEEDYRNKYEFE